MLRRSFKVAACLVLAAAVGTGTWLILRGDAGEVATPPPSSPRPGVGSAVPAGELDADLRRVHALAGRLAGATDRRSCAVTLDALEGTAPPRELLDEAARVADRRLQTALIAELTSLALIVEDCAAPAGHSRLELAVAAVDARVSEEAR